MGATFDRELLEEVGLKLLAREAKLRAASLVLAPTCNIQRVRDKSFLFQPPLTHLFFLLFCQNPLGGRVSKILGLLLLI